ncbi:hypothetical protein N802_04235 [Knoellia sinensis KCTC 19936]|uniref:Mycothiol-dependent maleylpyruvate isomerase metal-binding domain-containing protein n=1 Tax=Knoellia sinensis KCTC 19936 TaxID=1385520 RepID=A0A0A0J2E2_9MICO|nr:hypothetical protein [Knoellia sinensis]KGN31303.1 hypothetical protein N802_04235 [Knoellia sinensis KCTC 19936]
MTLPFLDHLDLLDRHGRSAVAALGRLRPKDRLPPRNEPVRDVASAHWATLEIWAWSLEHPHQHWSGRAEPTSPTDHEALLAGVTTQLDRLRESLPAAGPDRDIDYFGHPGNVAQVARLLAHEAVATAHAACVAAGREVPTLRVPVAVDAIDHVITHWASSTSGATWRPRPFAVRDTDTRQVHYIVASDGDDPTDFRRASPQTPSAVVEGPAVDLLWWLHGYPTAEGVVAVSGNEEDVRGLLTTFHHPVQKPHRKRRWFGWS